MAHPSNPRILTAIIPLANRQVGFDLPGIPNFCLPVGKNLGILEAAIFECLCVGARSIYIVIDDSEAGLTKRIIGDAAYSYGNDDAWFSKEFWGKLKRIPLVYVPLTLSDILNKSFYGHGIVRAFETIENITSKLSSYAVPSHYYVKFPFGVLPGQQLVKGRSLMLNAGLKSTLFRSSDLTVRDDEPLSACLTQAHIQQLCEHSRFEKSMTLSKMFSCLPETEIDFKDVQGYHRVDTWERYREFMHSDVVIYAPNTFLRAKAFNEFAGTKPIKPE